MSWPDHPNERAFADWSLGQLGEWFEVDREVAGKHCDGRRLRLDAVLRPSDPGGWKDPAPALGVEFKLPGGKGSFDTRDFTAWTAQAIDYTHVEWGDYGRLAVFICPSPVVELSALGNDVAFFAAHLLGQFRVGELARVQGEGWALLMHGSHILWSQRRGVHEGKRWGLRPKVGSR